MKVIPQCAAGVLIFGSMLVGGIRLLAQAPSSPAPASSTSSATSASTPPTSARLPGPAASAGEPDPNALRIREGTQLSNRLGHFKQNGESLTFVDEEGRELGGLPNLSLERVIRMLKSVEDPEAVTWSVSGTVTEFAGRNYLLVSRAVYKAATVPPAPDRLGQ